jgi:hypothetical protein
VGIGQGRDGGEEKKKMKLGLAAVPASHNHCLSCSLARTQQSWHASAQSTGQITSLPEADLKNFKMTTGERQVQADVDSKLEEPQRAKVRVQAPDYQSALVSLACIFHDPFYCVTPSPSL